jgi:hypothetical protein
LSDFTPEGRRAAVGVVQDFAAHIPEHMEAAAASKRRQADNARAKGGKSAENAKAYDAAANRFEKQAPVVRAARRRPGTIAGMAQNNVEAVELAATTHRMTRLHPQNGRPMHPESLGGAGWYHAANTAVDAQVPTGFHMDASVAASSKLSQGTKPEDERASMGSAARAIHNDVKVHVTPEIAQHWSNRGLPAIAHANTMASYADLPGAHAAALAEPKMRDHMEQSNGHIGWKEMGRAGSSGNRAAAHDILTGRTPVSEAQSPFTAPKTNRYTANIAGATSRTQVDKDRSGEYHARGAHMGDLIRGDVHHGQEMLDLYGQRHDTTGFNSPKLSTPQDSWQMGIHNVGLGTPTAIKPAGDITPGSKRHGVTAHPDARVGAAAVVHAVHDEATIQAAARLTKKYRPGYAVPSALVQETGWTGVRRLEGTGTGGTGTADKAWNENQRQHAEAKKPQKVKYVGQDASKKKKQKVSRPRLPGM